MLKRSKILVVLILALAIIIVSASALAVSNSCSTGANYSSGNASNNCSSTSTDVSANQSSCYTAPNKTENQSSCYSGNSTAAASKNSCSDNNSTETAQQKSYLSNSNAGQNALSAKDCNDLFASLWQYLSCFMGNQSYSYLGVPEGTSLSVPASTNGKFDYMAFAEELVELVNAERTKVGVAPVTLDQQLCAAALIRAEEIQSVWGHTRPDGSSPFTALDPSYKYRYAGENIANGQTTPQEVMTDWMNSQGHREAILNENYKKIGIGIVPNDGSSKYAGYAWAQMFTD